MDAVNRTLYIPLYGKALVSRKGILLHDPKAEEIWDAEGFALKGKSKSKWLAYYMAMRAAAFDRWVAKQVLDDPNAVVLHLGCGLDNRIGRVAPKGVLWYDVDFPDVIRQRKCHYEESDHYKMLPADVREGDWLQAISAEHAIVVMEGISMYLKPEELTGLLTLLAQCFSKVSLLMDCYSVLAAKMSKVKNPVNDVGVTEVYGLDDPHALTKSAFGYVGECEITPEDLISQLQGMEETIFRKLYAGNMSKKLYRMYEFGK